MKFATTINTILLLASAASACIYKRAEDDAAAARWGYTGADGPLHWHTLDAANSKCASGTNQSPINVVPELLKPADACFEYPNAGDFTVLNNGHTIQLTPLEYGAATPDYSQSAYKATLDGTDFSLMQFHFHTPSEHVLNGVSYPLEIHFVHTAPETGALAVVGIFFDIVSGAGEEFTCKLAPRMSRHTARGIYAVSEANQTSEIKKLPLAGIAKHVGEHPVSHYSGSLTTPPCTEDIRWYVSQEPLKISVDEYHAFKDIMKFNSRYVQNAPGVENLLAPTCKVDAGH